MSAPVRRWSLAAYGSRHADPHDASTVTTTTAAGKQVCDERPREWNESRFYGHETARAPCARPPCPGPLAGIRFTFDRMPCSRAASRLCAAGFRSRPRRATSPRDRRPGCGGVQPVRRPSPRRSARSGAVRRRRRARVAVDLLADPAGGPLQPQAVVLRHRRELDGAVVDEVSWVLE